MFLIIDDDPVITDLFNEALAMNGFAGDVLNDATFAFSVLASEPDKYDKVFVDKGMPGKSGVELANEINRIRPSLPVILMSTTEKDYDDIEASNKNLFTFAVKPKNVEQIINLISM
jgi:DNA-binding NtrC family response regulator